MNKQITLQDIYQVVNRVEDKMDERLKVVEAKVDKLEDLGSKIVVVWGFVSVLLTATFTWAWSKITKTA